MENQDIVDFDSNAAASPARPDQSEGSDKRRSDRHKIDQLVLVYSDDYSKVLRYFDLSVGGLCIRAKRAFNPKDRLQMNLNLKMLTKGMVWEETCIASAEVVHSVYQKEYDAYLTGLRFVDLEPQVMQAIEAACSYLEAQNRPPQDTGATIEELGCYLERLMEKSPSF
ncbi:MAG: PilZ domain-containing protein [Deltaproteobacteria bacterium]|nr:PilZ domain-containing protein [Deltaproteobacteria bacterium]